MLLPVGVHRGSGDEAHLVVVNLAVVVLAEELIQVDEGLLLDVALVKDEARDLGEFRVTGPDLGGLLEFLLEGDLVAADGGIAGLGEVQGADLLGGLNRGGSLRGIEIRSRGAQLADQLFRKGVVLDLERGEQLVALLDKLERLALLGARQGANFRQIFAGGEGLREAFGRAFHLVLAEEILEGLNALAHVADDFIRHAVQGAHGRGHARRVLEEIVAILAELEPSVAIGEDGPVKTGADENMLESALEKELHQEGLEFHLRVEF